MSTVERTATLPAHALTTYTPPVIVTTGAVAGRVVSVKAHPRAERIWLATVDLGRGLPVQIVFGGKYEVRPGELVPVAPPGAFATVVPKDEPAGPRIKKMRSRRYRGERSHGMLCSLDELGWIVGGPDEVAILRHVSPGDSLDDVPARRQVEIVARPGITVVDVVPQAKSPVSYEVDLSAAKD